MMNEQRRVPLFVRLPLSLKIVALIWTVLGSAFIVHTLIDYTLHGTFSFYPATLGIFIAYALLRFLPVRHAQLTKGSVVCIITVFLYGTICRLGMEVKWENLIDLGSPLTEGEARELVDYLRLNFLASCWMFALLLIQIAILLNPPTKAYLDLASFGSRAEGKDPSNQEDASTLSTAAYYNRRTANEMGDDSQDE